MLTKAQRDDRRELLKSAAILAFTVGGLCTWPHDWVWIVFVAAASFLTGFWVAATCADYAMEREC